MFYILIIVCLTCSHHCISACMIVVGGHAGSLGFIFLCSSIIAQTWSSWSAAIASSKNCSTYFSGWNVQHAAQTLARNNSINVGTQRFRERHRYHIVIALRKSPPLLCVLHYVAMLIFTICNRTDWCRTFWSTYILLPIVCFANTIVIVAQLLLLLQLLL